ncbi:MAG: hypothetical protein ACXVUL_22040 [Solirubrobacteraceae bacterium]
MKFRLGILVTVLLLSAGCGSSATSSSGPKVSPEQYDNSQRDVAYVRAIDQIMRPFSKPPENPTDYLGATRRLRTAIGKLESLVSPPVFAASQRHLMA